MNRPDESANTNDDASDDASDPRPAPPERPLPGDCCRSGCNPCVFDLYDEALERYEAQLRAWEARHAHD